MSVLGNLEPKNVFKYFEEITKIPRESGNMEKIAAYCIKFAEDRGFVHYTDELHNVIIVKEATAGYENSPSIIIQGHLDMVCEKTPDKDIDFATEGIQVKIDGDRIVADRTSLGADNGIAVAMALAILDSDDIQHPKLEVVFTTDEETGLYGAEAIDVSMLTSKKFINLDSEDEGVITVGCAGGVSAEIKLPVTREEVEGEKLTVSIEGLQGGHSGIEINTGRANGNVLAGRLLYIAKSKSDFRTVNVRGGRADNVITNKTVIEVVLDKGQTAAFKEAVKQVEAELKVEYAVAEPDMKFVISGEGHGNAKALTKEAEKTLISFLLNMPNGITAMSMDIKDLVETSLNLGVFETKEDHMWAVSGLRSSHESAKWALRDRVVDFVTLLGGTVEMVGNYPGWAYAQESPLRDAAVEVYKEQYGKEPVIEAIHAGLECGMFSEKIDGLDCISIGPDLRNVHSVDEWMSIPSVQRTWEYVLNILKASK